jgi:predicted AAA+ superfamily ATPase
MESRFRYLETEILKDALASWKMAFVSGPRQVGKTTLARHLLQASENYFSWDQESFRRSWIRNPAKAISERSDGPIALDEIHKQRLWKRSLKGVYDELGSHVPIIVTGSARLDLYRKGGDSLLGRYLPYRLHPFSVAETSDIPDPDRLEPKATRYPLRDLLALGTFPEPLLGGSRPKALRWSRIRRERILREDVYDLRAVTRLPQLKLLMELIPTKVGAPFSLQSIQEDLQVAYETVRSWAAVLNSLYFTFSLSPYSKKISRSLKAEKKIYCFDLLPIESPGAALENLVALHLLKSCHAWTDTAKGEFELYYLRTKEKEEVDFCVVRDRKVWMLVECKSSETDVAPALSKFTRLLTPAHSFQTVLKSGYDRNHPATGVRVIDVEKFLSMLV